MMGRYPHLDRFAFPDPEDHRQVDEIMDHTGTREFENRFISELSGGERQRRYCSGSGSGYTGAHFGLKPHPTNGHFSCDFALQPDISKSDS